MHSRELGRVCGGGGAVRTLQAVDGFMVLQVVLTTES